MLLENLVSSYIATPSRRIALDFYFETMAAAAAQGDEGLAIGLLTAAATFLDRDQELPRPLRRVAAQALRGMAKGQKGYQAVANTVGRRGNRKRPERIGPTVFRYAELIASGMTVLDAEAQVGAELCISSERVNQIIDEYVRRPKRAAKL